jgi:RNase P subunit RPR2
MSPTLLRCEIEVFHSVPQVAISPSLSRNNFLISYIPTRNSNDLTKEVVMTTVASFRNADPETTCAKCGEPLIAPEWSEFVSEGLVLNLWTCTSCGNRFETEVCMPADAEANAEAIKDFFPSLLIA